MRKLSQKELISEGFGDLLRGAVKAAARGVGAAARGTAKAISPTAAGIIGKSVDTMGGALANIQKSDPKSMLNLAFTRSDAAVNYQDVQLGKEVTLPNKDRSIEFKANYIDAPRSYEKVPITGRVIMRRRGDSGVAADEWKIIEIQDANHKKLTIPNSMKNEVYASADTEQPQQTPTTTQNTDEATTSNFKDKLNNFKAKIKEPGIGYSQLTVNEFVRELAKKAGNTTWSKNLPSKISKIKNNNKNWSNAELQQLATNLLQAGILKESQKNLLNHLQSISK